jgi:DNA modification methylase
VTLSPILLHGPAADVLRQQVASAAVDMAYADPPFGNQQVWSGTAGSFDDRWQWSPAAAAGWAALREHCPAGADLIAAIAPEPNARAYLGVMADILLEVRRVLKPTGTLWLHFDDCMGARLRILGDVVFGPANQLGAVVWRRSSGRTSRRAFARVHDTIACFGKTRVAQWRLARIRSDLVAGDPCEGVRVDGLLDDRLAATSSERIGYPTQKPLDLIKRFILAGSLPGDVVLDPTCGSGTTLVAATMLGRRAIGVDRSSDAIAAARARLQPTVTAVSEAAHG